MRNPIFATLLCIALAACGSKPKGWLIQSYDDGGITVKHEDKIYRAVCESHLSQDPGVPESFRSDPTCRIAVDLVGREIQTYGGEKREPNGTIVAMLHSGRTLGIRIWRDEHSPWEADYFTIKTVH